MILWTES